MAIEHFKKVHLVAHRTVERDLLGVLQRLGVLDLTAAAVLPPRGKPGDGERDLETSLRRIDEVARLLTRHVAKDAPKRAAGRPRMTEDELGQLEEGFGLDSFLGEFDEIRARVDKLRADDSRLEEERRRLEPWREADVSLDALRPSARTGVLAGRVRLADRERMLAAAEEAGAAVVRAGEDSQHVSWIAFFLRGQEGPVREALVRVGFQPLDLPPVHGIPAERIAEIDHERDTLRKAVCATEEGYGRLAPRRAELLIVRDLVAGRLDRLRAEGLLGDSQATVSIEGWIPERLLEPAREAVLSRFSLVSFEAANPTPADRVPVLLDNPMLARPFEAVIELYGLPRYGGIDPTPVLAVFYALSFGFCLTDAGYGILLAAASGTAMLLTPAAVYPERRRFFALFFLGGIATIVLGAATGGWFGVTVPFQLLDPFKDLMLFFACALAFGVLHLFAGLILRMIHQMRRGRVLAPLLDQGLWMTLVGPLLGLLVVKAGKLPAAFGPPLAFASLASAVGIVFFQGRGEPREPRVEAAHNLLWGGMTIACTLGLLGIGRPWSWIVLGTLFTAEVVLLRGRFFTALGRVGLGLYALYGVSGYLSDILSYSRLVALGLGTGTVAMVVNTMAGQAVGLPYGIGYVLAGLILVVGHLFNIAINLLGAFVHSCRLQYVEFFTKFYEAGGRAYSPFRRKAKHVTIVSDGLAA